MHAQEREHRLDACPEKQDKAYRPYHKGELSTFDMRRHRFSWAAISNRIQDSEPCNETETVNQELRVRSCRRIHSEII
jgi:hypothetical protein